MWKKEREKTTLWYFLTQISFFYRLVLLFWAEILVTGWILVSNPCQCCWLRTLSKSLVLPPYPTKRNAQFRIAKVQAQLLPRPAHELRWSYCLSLQIPDQHIYCAIITQSWILNKEFFQERLLKELGNLRGILTLTHEKMFSPLSWDTANSIFKAFSPHKSKKKKRYS